MKEIVITLKNEVIPIDVKYSLINFCEEFNTRGLVITKDLLRDDGNIIFIPAWLFLMMI
ncbi:MAG: hypothetical protein O8C61_01310 [Candidatus Methanoperedens sp.]|nr:hypothetical protein [Candidatus Methanoperedens sp.]